MAESIHLCCDPSSPSPIWTGKPTGKVNSVEGIETYVARPPAVQEKDDAGNTFQGNLEEKRVTLHLTEGHSMYFINAQLLADSSAKYLHCDVIMPDQFAGQERVPRGMTPNFPQGKPEVPTTDDVVTPPPPYFLSEFTSLETWQKRYLPSVTDPIIDRVQYIHATYGPDVKVGVWDTFSGADM
jgi:hypothetical protein